MRQKDYTMVREALEPIFALGNIDAEDLMPLSEILYVADKKNSITFLPLALCLLFDKDIGEEI